MLPDNPLGAEVKVKKHALVFWALMIFLLGVATGAKTQQFLEGKTHGTLTAQEADRIYAEGFAWGEAEGRARK